MTTTCAPAPRSAAHISWSSTDLPEPDLPQIATLWLPASFSNGDQKKGCPRRPTNSRCGWTLPRYSPCMGAILAAVVDRSEEHTSELQSLMRISYAVFCLKKKNDTSATNNDNVHKPNTMPDHYIVKKDYSHDK